LATRARSLRPIIATKRLIFSRDFVTIANRHAGLIPFLSFSLPAAADLAAVAPAGRHVCVRACHGRAVHVERKDWPEAAGKLQYALRAPSRGNQCACRTGSGDIVTN
jgi:hypothetical protein